MDRDPLRRPTPLPQAVVERLRAEVPEMTALMGAAILVEVAQYRADPSRYRPAVLDLCRLAVRLFLRILATGEPPGSRELAVVERVGNSIARQEEPLEPLLHALRIGARVGWDETLRVSQDQGGATREELLKVAGQVFEYIDQLSSRIAESYARQVRENVRTEALNESEMFDELVAGRWTAELAETTGGARPLTALALAAGGAGRQESQQTAEAVAARIRIRLPRAVAGRRGGMHIWLMVAEPPRSLLEECAATHDVAFGISSAGDEVPLARAAEEASFAARVGLELRGARKQLVTSFTSIYPYAALRADPVALGRSQATLLGPLARHPGLLATLREYFATNRSVSRTAERIHLHRQSVVYRLQRVSELLGISLTDAEALWRLESAVRGLPPGP